MTRVLALDYGSARCGCAVSDPTGVLATPIEQFRRHARGGGWGACARSYRAGGGAGGGRPAAVALRRGLGADAGDPRVRRDLRRELQVPVELYDERFTTGSRPERGRSAEEDSRAAALLLEGWLERARHG